MSLFPTRNESILKSRTVLLNLQNVVAKKWCFQYTVFDVINSFVIIYSVERF